MSIRHEEAALTQRAVPGPALYSLTTIPEGPPKAALGILHGWADHGARYAHAMDRWAEKGILSVALDMRGHGRATGPRGYCARFEEYLDDAAELARLVADRAHGAPMFLFGHSFGGLVAASSVIESPRSWRGLVLSGPYFDLAMPVPAVKIYAGKIASRIIPKLGIPAGLSGKDACGDPARARAYDEDPLVFKNATARWFTETVKAQGKAMERAHLLSMPLLVAFGAEDRVAKMSAARRFFDMTASKDKRFDELPGVLHEPLSETKWEPIADTIADWVLSHAQPAEGKR